MTEKTQADACLRRQPRIVRYCLKISIENYRFREALGDDAAIKIIADAGFDAMDFSYYWVKNAPDPLGDDYLDFAKRPAKAPKTLSV